MAEQHRLRCQVLLDPYHHVIPAFQVIILELVFRLLGIDQLNVTFSLQIMELGINRL